MSRTLSVAEARSQLSALVKEVAAGDEQVVITAHNQPKAIIVGYAAFQRQQQPPPQATRPLPELIAEAKALIQTTQKGCHRPGEPELYLFLVNFKSLMWDIWRSAQEISRAHTSIATQLLSISHLYLSGEDILRPEQLAPLDAVLTLLTRDQLTMEDASEADRYLLAHGINSLFPVHGDLVSLYEESEPASL